MTTTTEQAGRDANRESEGRHWSLDRRVPIALIWTILAQTSLAIWWARGQQANVESALQRLTLLEAQRAGDRVGERLSTVESQMSDAKDLLRRIDDRTQRLVERSVERRP